MKHWKYALLSAALLAAVCITPASALEYTMEAPDDYLFARPTSDSTIYEQEDPNVDRSKNTALIPPGFGTPTSYLPGSGAALTPQPGPRRAGRWADQLHRERHLPGHRQRRRDLDGHRLYHCHPQTSITVAGTWGP